MKRACLVPLLLLTACHSGNPVDLQQFVNQPVPAGKIAPLPPTPVVPSFNYTASNLPDPFALRPELIPVKPGEKKKTVLRHPHQPLEAWPLDKLKLVGVISKNGRAAALVRIPDGTVRIAHVGDYVGQNDQRISHITDSVVLLSTAGAQNKNSKKQAPATRWVPGS